MRLIKSLVAISVVAAAFSSGHADTLPVGTYYLSGHTSAATIHASPDQGTLTGTLTFSASSDLTSANLLFQDTTDGLNFSFTVPGLTVYTPAAHTFSASIYNSADPTILYYFSINTQPSGPTFNLTCGVDCDTDAIIPGSTGQTKLNEEVTGTISPVPEPSTLALLSTGLVAVAGAVRRRVR